MGAMEMRAQKLVFLLLPAFILLVAFRDRHKRLKQSVTVKEYKAEWEMQGGLRDGKYVSYYPNGKKKAEGSFKANQRYGDWYVWDSTGKLKVRRLYQDNFRYRRIYPVYPAGPAQLLDTSVWQMKYNAKGYVDYFYLQERAVAVSKRIWRYVPAKQPSLLLLKDQFVAALADSIKNGTIKVYADDEFRSKKDKAFFPGDSIAGRLLGFKIKEDWFYDTDRMLAETRILGICPVLRGTNGTDSIEAGWFYLPQIRPLLASVESACNAVNENRWNLDNVFYFRNFSSSIYRESTVYNRALRDYASGENFGKEQLRIEASLIEMEHDHWLFFTK